MANWDPFESRYDTKTEIGAIASESGSQKEIGIKLAGNGEARRWLALAQQVAEGDGVQDEIGFLGFLGDVFRAIGKALAEVVVREVSAAVLDMLPEEWKGFGVAFEFLGTSLVESPADASSTGLVQIVNNGSGDQLMANLKTQLVAVGEFTDRKGVDLPVFGSTAGKMITETFGGDFAGHQVELAASTILLNEIPSDWAKGIEQAVARGSEVDFMALARKAWAWQAEEKGDVRASMLLLTTMYEQQMMKTSQSVKELPHMPVPAMVKAPEVQNGIPAMALISKRLDDQWFKTTYVERRMAAGRAAGTPTMMRDSDRELTEEAKAQLEQDLGIVGRWLEGEAGLSAKYRRILQANGIQPSISAEGEVDMSEEMNTYIALPDGKGGDLDDVLRNFSKDWYTEKPKKRWKMLLDQVGQLQKSINEYADKYDLLGVPNVYEKTVSQVLGGTDQEDWIPKILDNFDFGRSPEFEDFWSDVESGGFGLSFAGTRWSNQFPISRIPPPEYQRMPNGQRVDVSDGKKRLYEIMGSDKLSRHLWLGTGSDNVRRVNVFMQGWKNYPGLMEVFTARTFRKLPQDAKDHFNHELRRMLKFGKKYWDDKNTRYLFSQVVDGYWENKREAADQTDEKAAEVSEAAPSLAEMLKKLRKIEVAQVLDRIRSRGTANSQVSDGVAVYQGDLIPGHFERLGNGYVPVVTRSGLIVHGDWQVA